MVLPPQGSGETEVEAVHDQVPAELHNLHDHDEGDPAPVTATWRRPERRRTQTQSAEHQTNWCDM